MAFPPPKRPSSAKRFKYLGGKTRRYRDVRTGETISRRQYEKFFPPKSILKTLGIKKAKKRVSHNRAQQHRYQRLVEDYIRHKKQDGLTVRKRGVRNSEAFRDIVRNLKSKDEEKKANALFEVGRIRKEEIITYIEKFEKEGGGVKLELRWRVVSKKTGLTAFEGSYRECIRWISFGTRRQRYKLESEVLDDETGDDE